MLSSIELLLQDVLAVISSFLLFSVDLAWKVVTQLWVCLQRPVKCRRACNNDGNCAFKSVLYSPTLLGRVKGSKIYIVA